MLLNFDYAKKGKCTFDETSHDSPLIWKIYHAVQIISAKSKFEILTCATLPPSHLPLLEVLNTHSKCLENWKIIVQAEIAKLCVDDPKASRGREKEVKQH